MNISGNNPVSHQKKDYSFNKNHDDGGIKLIDGQIESKNKKTRLIVQSADPFTLKFLKEEGKMVGNVIRDLPIINGFSVEVNGMVPEWLSQYAKSDSNVSITNDALFLLKNIENNTNQLQNNVKNNSSILMEASYSIKSLLKRILAQYHTANSRDVAGGLDVTMKVIGMDKVWERGFTGKGVTVAFVDSGVYPHPDFKERIAAWKDMDESSNFSPHDERGHGTHLAGLIVGDGKMSNGCFKGAAPGASLAAVKIKSEINNERDEFIAVSEAIAGLQWILDNHKQYNIRVVNLSLGVTPTKGWKDDPWAQAVEKLVSAGIAVVTVAGNENDPLFCKCITTPGIAPSAITVGAIDDQNTVDSSDDTIYYRSSRGPTIDGLQKPDVVAPGVNITSTLAPGSQLAKDNSQAQHYIDSSGTSEAAPIVSGLIAVLLEANPDLQPIEVKEILKQSAQPMTDVEANAQGAGVINAVKALELALARRKQAA